MSKRDILEHDVIKWGLRVGKYDSMIEKMRWSEFRKILGYMEHGTNDVDVKIEGVDHVVEIEWVDDSAIDFSVTTRQEYNARCDV